MTYILENRFRLRGWKNRLGGLYDSEAGKVFFIDKERYLLLMKCDGAHDIDPESLTEKQRKALDDAVKEGVIREAKFLEFLSPVQEYKSYPAAYKRSVHWSITGACNLKCRHCFMSAPHAKHGAPTYEQIIKIADSIAECGIFDVGITGGEPLIRDDFLDIVSALSDRGIKISTLYTNGWLVDEDNCFFFENGWEERLTAAVRPAFEEYIKRCPPKKREGAGKKETKITPDNCP